MFLSIDQTAKHRQRKIKLAIASAIIAAGAAGLSGGGTSRGCRATGGAINAGAITTCGTTSGLTGGNLHGITLGAGAAPTARGRGGGFG